MEKIWFQDISHFITSKNYMVFFPSSEMSFAEQLNSLMRITIYFAVIMFILKKDANILFVPICMGLFTFFVYTVDQKNKREERKLIEKMGLQRDPVMNQLCQRPSKDNPFMNVLVSDYALRPERPKACKIQGKVKCEVKRNFDRNLYRDIDDIFHKKASDRQFYTTPSTTIPNDSTGYARWLYGNGATCKEGNGDRCYTNMYRTINV